MSRIEKTVFISYRRTNAPWALAIYQYLNHHGNDAFIDFQGIASGGFELIILENIRARAHFLVLLTPSALEYCGDPKDWLRREIETAMESRRNVVPVMLDGFDFEAPSNVSRLTGQLLALKDYNALRVYAEYFAAAMDRLRGDFLNVPLESVSHPASLSTPARHAAEAQQAAASAAPAVGQEELTAQTWFEKGFNAVDPAERIRCYTEAIRLKPDYAEPYYNRGNARYDKGDLDGALKDYTEAIRLNPNFAIAYFNRGNTRRDKGDFNGALKDYDEAIRLKPDLADAYNNRGNARGDKGDHDGALKDYTEAIRLKPDYAKAHYNRGVERERRAKGDPASAKGAIADFQKYLNLGGGIRDGDQAEVEQFIRDLKNKQ
jgi:tetratricopeptide (TPR) repeat protein